jgi:hypothetical protein
MTTCYLDDEPEVLSYLDKTWLSYKEKICYAWTNRITHYGNASGLHCR